MLILRGWREKAKRIIPLNMTGKSDRSRVLPRAPEPVAEPGVDSRLRLNLRLLEVFVATARSGSTRAAAQRVARSQSAASTALAELESLMGQPLFDRVGRRLVLNPQGEALLPQAIALLDHAAEVQGLFETPHHTPLRLAASLTIGEYLLPSWIAAWKLAHPDSTVRLKIANTSEVIAAVVGLEVDLGFIEGPPAHADLRVQPWLSDELVIVAAPTHPLARGSATHRQLAEAAWILREPGSGTRQASDAWLVARLGPLHVEFELGSTEALKRLAAAGAGLACLSRHTVADELAAGTLVELKTRLPTAARRLAIVVRRDRRLGRAAAAFLAHCRDVPGASPPRGSH